MQENITDASTTDNNNNNRIKKNVKMFLTIIKSQNTQINVIIITTTIYEH